MRRLRAMLWKECSEQRWFFLAGVVLFFLIPLGSATIIYCKVSGRFDTDDAIGMVLCFGGLYAIVLGVGAVCRDLSGGLHTFWRSRPVSTTALFTVKYAVALAILLSLTCGALAMTAAMRVDAFHDTWYRTEAFPILLCHTPLLVLILSVAFLLGCLIRHAARAAMLAILAGLLFYFAPTLVAALSPFSVFGKLLEWSPAFRLYGPSYSETPQHVLWDMLLHILPLLLTAIAGSGLALAGACLAVSRGWQVQAHKRVLGWSLVVVFLVLWAAAAFQVGSDLKCRRTFTVKTAGGKERFHTRAMATDGRRGVLIGFDSPSRWISDEVGLDLCSFSLDEASLHAGPPLRLSKSPSSRDGDLAWSPDHPGRAYFISRVWDKQKIISQKLLTIDLGGEAPTIVNTLDLAPYATDSAARVCVYGDRLYVLIGWTLLTLRTDSPGEPQILQNVRVDLYRYGWGTYQIGDSVNDQYALDHLWLLPLEGASQQERVEVSVRLTRTTDVVAFDGGLLVQVRREEGVAAYRLGRVEGDVAYFEPLGRRQATPLERMVGKREADRVVVRNGRAYVLWYTSEAGLEVYDVRGPGAPRRIGHYIAPNEQINDLAVLDDGSVLLAGNTMTLLEPARSSP